MIDMQDRYIELYYQHFKEAQARNPSMLFNNMGHNFDSSCSSAAAICELYLELNKDKLIDTLYTDIMAIFDDECWNGVLVTAKFHGINQSALYAAAVSMNMKTTI